MLDVDVDVGSDWPEPDWADWVTRAAEAALRALGRTDLLADKPQVELSVRLDSDAAVQALNAAWRGKDRPTNVLSFPQFDGAPPPAGEWPDDIELMLGDIILARETCARESIEKSVELSVHARHLVIHGTLHLMGLDHQTKDEAEAMETIERTAMAALGLSDPYAADGVCDA